MRTPEAQARRAERRFEVTVHRNLTRNFTAHLLHGMLGQTGFRLVNAPTFLPAYVLMLSGGSNVAVGAALAVQSLGMMITPFFGATLIEHRPKVLPVGMVIGTAMRLSVLGIALSGLLLPPDLALAGIFASLVLFGLFQGVQGVLFNFLMSKVIPVSKRGRLTGLRNFLAGITSAAVAYTAGEYFLGDSPDIAGYSHTFILAFVLTMCGLLMLLFMKEPAPPVLRSKSSVATRLRELPALLRDDPDFARYLLARALANTGRMALPFYVVYAGTSMQLSGANLALTTIAFTIAGTVSNLLWGALGDRYGFRLVFLSATGVWILATCTLLVSSGVALTVAVFAAVGAAVQGFQNASVNLTLEFGRREDLPARIAVANTASEFMGSIGPLAGGFIAASFGYHAVFAVAVAFLAAGGLMVQLKVRDPRRRVETGS
ncbi:MAG: MFS transporter [Pseudomonadales bacterium]